MTKFVTARARLEKGLRFEGEASSGHRLLMDTSIYHEGQNAGFRPIELFLLSIAGYAGMEVISILRKEGQQVTGYEVRVQGMIAETPQNVLEDITVEHIIAGRSLDHEIIRQAISTVEQRFRAACAILGQVAELRHMYCTVETQEPVLTEA